MQNGLRPGFAIAAGVALFGANAPVLAQSSPARADLPQDVAAFLDRQTKCVALFANGGRIGDKALLDLSCDTIAAERLVLQKQYAAAPTVIAALGATFVKIVQRVPLHIALPPIEPGR
jgi:hypothetical protein